MLESRLSAGAVSMLAAALAALTLVATATAAGPFWHHRAIGGEGQGEKIEPKAPENFKGTGGKQLFRAKIGTSEIVFGSPSVQVKGAIFNGPFQGQMKAELVYSQPQLEEPALSNCAVHIGEKNIIVTKGYLMWKWDGTAAQREESPAALHQTVDGIFSAVEPPHQKISGEIFNFTGKGNLTTISLSGPGCGVLVGTFPVSGAYVGTPNLGIEEFSRKVSIRVLDPGKEKGTFFQHYFNGEAMQGAEVGLQFDANPAAYFLGQTTVEAAQQEVAVFEK